MFVDDSYAEFSLTGVGSELFDNGNEAQITQITAGSFDAEKQHTYNLTVGSCFIHLF